MEGSSLATWTKMTELGCQMTPIIAMTFHNRFQYHREVTRRIGALFPGKQLYRNDNCCDAKTGDWGRQVNAVRSRHHHTEIGNVPTTLPLIQPQVRRWVPSP